MKTMHNELMRMEELSRAHSALQVLLSQELLLLPILKEELVLLLIPILRLVLILIPTAVTNTSYYHERAFAYALGAASVYLPLVL